MIYVCAICGYEYDEEKEGVNFVDLPNDWTCPVCCADQGVFYVKKADDGGIENVKASVNANMKQAESVFAKLLRGDDEVEKYMKYIHTIANDGHYISEAMRTPLPVVSWEEILFKGGQLAVRPLDSFAEVDTKVVIGKNAKKPMVLESPIIISHMSFGALSKEAKIALAVGSGRAGCGFCSGEGGMLEETFKNAYKYIFEYVPNKYSVTDENLQRVDAIEIKFGQSAKPGMGGHLPGAKVTEDIAKARGKKVGEDILSPSAFPDILNTEDLINTVNMLRERSGGRPIGIKLAAGHIEADIAIAVRANPDFITIDGRPGGTGSAPKFLKDSSSIPTIYALHRARKCLDKLGAKDISLISTGGYRISSDFAKAIAMGADAVAIASAAMMAIGCQQYRICGTDKCPMGIATQDPELRKRFNIEKSAAMVENYLKTSLEEMKHFARICGKDKLSLLNVKDICTTSEEIAKYTNIQHVGEAEDF